jgi:cyclic beta-1,2-glucan synthetase
MAFVGRGRSAADAVALGGELTGTSGTVLDPAFSLRCRFTLAPRAQVEVSFITLAADSRDALMALVERFKHHDAISRSFEAAWTQAQLEFRYLGIKAPAAHRYQELLSPLIYPHAGMRPAADRLAANRLGQSGLWVHGVSGDLPILLVTVTDARGIGLVRDVLIAHAYWRMRGFSSDLIILDQEPYSYEQPLRSQIGRLLDAHRVHPGVQPGGVFLLDWHSLTEESRTLLLAAAHVVLAGGRGNLTQQLAAPADSAVQAPLLSADGTRPPMNTSTLPFLELPYFNGIGGFSQDGREYAIYLKSRDTTPLPWSNVIATPSFGTVVTESGLGFTWYGNSQANRLTPWQNDPVRDPQAEIVYIRDEESGAVWTPTALPIREDTAYRARHGQGYTFFEHNSHGIRQEMTVFVPLDDSGGDPVKIVHLRLHSEDSRVRTLTVTWYVEWVLGSTREENQRHVQTSFDVDSATLLAKNVWQPSFGTRMAFIAMSPLPQSWTGDRTAFLGRNGGHGAPDALKRVRLDARTGAGLDPAGAMQSRIRLQPGETVEVICLLGQGANVDEVRHLVSRYRNPGEVAAALSRTKGWWDHRLGALQVKLPVLSVQFLLNRWLPYQTLSCRFWARSAFYQSGGAYGFRDQLQDCMAFVYLAPEMARQHILTAAARQFPEGDVQHWWHPDTGAGPRTRCSDDMLWLPYVVAHYVRVTGDESILSERVPFIDGPELEPGQDEHLFVPGEDPTRGVSLFDHCTRAIERGHQLGTHGIPLFGNGDWNDGMNRVGHEGKGESVWMAWFLAAVLREFAPLVTRPEEYRQRADALVKNIEAHCWDGAWYVRGFFDDGSPLGSRLNEEARIDSLPQSWAVIAGGGDPLRARAGIVSAMEHLVKKDPRQVLLFTPGFDHSTPHPGYIMGYPPGIRENGGQYTHGSLWLPLALTRLGLNVEAAGLMQLMNPVEATRDLAGVMRYGGEPYVVPADVYSSPQHPGRCGWTWYTGAAAWMYRVWIESILGFRVQGDRVRIEPVLPSAWEDVELTYRRGKKVYRIQIKDKEIRVNGELLEGKGSVALAPSPSNDEITVHG